MCYANNILSFLPTSAESILQDYSNIYPTFLCRKFLSLPCDSNIASRWRGGKTVTGKTKNKRQTVAQPKEVEAKKGRINNLLETVWHERFEGVGVRTVANKKNRKRRAKLFASIFVQSHNTIYCGAQFLLVVSTCEFLSVILFLFSCSVSRRRKAIFCLFFFHFSAFIFCSGEALKFEMSIDGVLVGGFFDVDRLELAELIWEGIFVIAKACFAM